MEVISHHHRSRTYKGGTISTSRGDEMTPPEKYANCIDCVVAMEAPRKPYASCASTDERLTTVTCPHNTTRTSTQSHCV
ncbi:hypothetical protein BHE74_00032133 [Ensete ventricosum]|nr:hypothetical protein BHE74_00032133 [Ensete ventricosum]RZR99798.1 hypothetical protein BHM03_00029409 [Ensete ventricosum]